MKLIKRLQNCFALSKQHHQEDLRTVGVLNARCRMIVFHDMKALASEENVLERPSPPYIRKDKYMISRSLVTWTEKTFQHGWP